MDLGTTCNLQQSFLFCMDITNKCFKCGTSTVDWKGVIMKLTVDANGVRLTIGHSSVCLLVRSLQMALQNGCKFVLMALAQDFM